MRAPWPLLTLLSLLALLAGGISIATAYFTDQVDLHASFAAVIPTSTETGTATAAAIETPTPTPTPPQCAGDHALVLLLPAAIGVHGDGPLTETLRVSNPGEDTARYVSLALQVVEGAEYLDDIEFGNGQIWNIDGQSGSTMYFVGDVSAGSTVDVEFSAIMGPAWLEERKPVASIEVTVASALCVQTPPDGRSTIFLRRPGVSTNSPEDRTEATSAIDPESIRVPGAPAATITPTPTQPALVMPTESPSSTPTSVPATETGTPTTTPTVTPTPTITPTPTAAPAP